MNRTSFALVLAAAMIFTTVGCSSKKYVRQQTTPIINKTNELDELTAKNTNAIKDVDARAQQGIQGVEAKAAAADQKAQAAGQQATEAQTLASQANTRVNTLQNQVVNLDNYRSVVDTSVHFGFNRDNLTPRAKQALDELISEVGKQNHFIITVEGGADAVGSKDYNYALSQRRAEAVIQYLASHGVPSYRIYDIGLGKDKPVASNRTAAGRAKNRRVDVHLMTNQLEGTQSAQAQQQGQLPQSSQPVQPQTQQPQTPRQ
jgi:outer membrane protein OmpA-like peptidoglycan-associated protein